MVGLDEGGEQLEGQDGGVRVDQPLAGREDPHRRGRGDEGLAGAGGFDDEVGAGLFVEAGDGGRVEGDVGVVQAHPPSGVEAVDVVLPGPGEHGAVGVNEPGGEDDVGVATVQVGAGDQGDLAHNADPVVGHRVVDQRRCDHLKVGQGRHGQTLDRGECG